jgi:hypothetical protein
MKILARAAKANWFSKKNQVVKVKAKLRSGLEDKIQAQLDEAGVEYTYESLKVPYSIPHNYNPDFILANGIIIEGKGLFTSEDRTKHLAVKKQHPHLDVRFVFTRSASPLYKGSKTTYGDWATKHGFKFADKLVPEAWLEEPAR